MRVVLHYQNSGEVFTKIRIAEIRRRIVVESKNNTRRAKKKKKKIEMFPSAKSYGTLTITAEGGEGGNRTLNNTSGFARYIGCLCRFFFYYFSSIIYTMRFNLTSETDGEKSKKKNLPPLLSAPAALFFRNNRGTRDRRARCCTGARNSGILAEFSNGRKGTDKK